MRPPCTCAGTAPGYPQHESWCGQESDEPGAEDRFRQILASQPYFGDWDEWAPIAYNKIPTLPHVAMHHLYGLHDDTTLPYACCVLCAYFRTDTDALEDVGGADEG